VSEASRRQRDGTEFIGGYGMKTSDSDLRFIEGQFPEHEGRVESDDSPVQQLEPAGQDWTAGHTHVLCVHLGVL
jgi:2-iminobutanoate/2-iminopropanoate deaminase